MKITSSIIPGLVATTVSAIDIYGYRNDIHCSGGDRIWCQNANPNDCCVRSSGNVFRAIGIEAIPTDWAIIGQAFTGGDCRNVRFVVQSLARRTICLGNDYYSGGNYKFASLKERSEACPASASSGDGDGDGDGCAAVHRGNFMEFEDGSSYNMTDLDDALYAELNGGQPADIPAKFDAYKLD
ncbi:hypothetical protein F4778DRAFT_771388 [Xylariomycetidae sp. FL2044]|nr:hypothetical protein F4778DRAFT_771388 [Xylariomycetidae sp. FL2044]